MQCTDFLKKTYQGFSHSELGSACKNRKIDNSADELRHLRSDAYSAEQVILTKQQFSDGGACLHCYRKIY